MRDAYVTVDLSALRDNVRAIRENYPEYRTIIGVVKGDTYGHGVRCAEALCEGGIDTFAVSTMDEALRLREHTGADIFLLEPVRIDDIPVAADAGLILPVSDMDYLKAFLSAAAGYSFRLHIQVDCGFNRLGFKSSDEIEQAVHMINDSPHTLDGIYQHFATAGINDRYYDEQIRRFEELTSGVSLDDIPLVHLCSGVTMVAHPKLPYATAARMGLMMYGYSVAPTSYGRGVKDKLREARDRYYRSRYKLTETITDVSIELRPAMRFSCRILQLKNVSKGEHIGYGAAYTAGEDMRIAILPVGYNNGIGHANRGRQVQIKDKLYSVIGAIGMNMMAVKVDDTVGIDDEVILLGDKITLGMFSRSSGLGLAEALVSIGRSNERIYKDQRS